MIWKYYVFTVALCINILESSSETLELDIGIFSKDSSAETVTYDRFPRMCDHFSQFGEQDCKYYGECCGDVVRIRERLEPGTYQCMNIGNTQGYVVNKCPMGTPEHLAQSCSSGKGSDHHEDGVFLKHWPVTGSYTGVTYSNIYCAICNGALHPVLENSMSPFDPLSAVEFWTANIHCTNQTVNLIETEEVEFNVKHLQNLLDSRECKVDYNPTDMGVHRHDCRNYRYTCPADFAEKEIRSLCEMGPVNKVFSGYTVYRNKFCKLCWEDIPESRSMTIMTGDLVRDILLASVKPLTQKLRESSLSDENYRTPEPLSDIYLAFPNNGGYYNITKRIVQSEEDLQLWHLGSIHCISHFSRVCGEFIVFPSEDEGRDCSGPGCGYNQVQDLSNSCVKLSDYQYNPSLTFQRKFHWAESEINKYFSTCDSSTKYNINCECDTRCYHFGTCCNDAGVPSSKPKHMLKSTCHELYKGNFPTGMVVVNSCPAGTSTEDVNLCESGDIGEWSTYGWFVTDTDTLITYKNIYCARCNRAGDVSFWDVSVSCDSDVIGNIIGTCTFQSYAPPINRTDFFYTCPLDKEYVSTCPDSYRKWRLADDCENGDVAYVYHKNKTFRNYFCAICHLGDEIVNVELTTRKTISKLTSPIPLISRPEGGKNLIRISYSTWDCCGSCLAAVYGPVDHCVAIDNTTSQLVQLGSSSSLSLGKNMSIVDLCGHSVLNCQQTTTTTTTSNPFNRGLPHPTFVIHPSENRFIAPKNRVSISSIDRFEPESHHSSSIIREVFRAVAMPDERFEQTTIISLQLWRPTNDSIMFCPNQTIVSNQSSNAYGRIMLSTTGLQILDVINTSAPVTTPPHKITLDTHHYVLISFSLVAIICNVLFIAIKKRKPLSLPDMMMISLLLSLFGALICFAVVTVPIGKDLIGCQALAAIMQFCFLSSLMWSNSIAISIVRSVYTMRLVSTSYKPFIMYSIYSFGVPLICVIITFILSKSTLKISKSIYRTTGLCFLGEHITMFSLFLVPMYILIVSNIIIGVLVMVKIVKTSCISSKNDVHRLKKNIITCFKVSICLGIGWVILFIANLNDDPVVWQVMQVFVELQGVLIAVANAISWSCVHSVKTWTRSLTTSSESQTKTTSAALSSSASVGNNLELEAMYENPTRK